MKTGIRYLIAFAVIVSLTIGLAFQPIAVYAGTFVPVTVTDQTTTAPLGNPNPAANEPRYVSGFGLDDSFTVFFEDRSDSSKLYYVQTATGPTGFPASATLTNIADTHFVVKDWPITVGATTYAYRAWGSVGNNLDHKFYVSNDLTNWTLVSTFTITNKVGWGGARGWVYYGFHDVIELNGTYYAFAESNQSQTMLVSSANGDDVWEAFASVGGSIAGDGPLQLPTGVSTGWTPRGNFIDLGHDRGYGKLYVDPRDNNFYLAVNTAAKASLDPADLEAAFINPANWTWHDGTTGPAANAVLSATAEHDLRECWVVPNTNPNDDWVIIYAADFGAGDGGKALGWATLEPPYVAPDEVWVDDDFTSATPGWGYDHFDNVQDGVDAVDSAGTIYVAAGTYVEAGQIVIDKDLTITGQGCGTTVIKTDRDTGTSGDARGWWLVNAGNVLNLNDLTLDGSGHKIYQGVRFKGSGTVSGACFTQIQYNASGPDYNGVAVAAMGDGTVDISGSVFDNIGRIGVIYFGSGVNGSVYDDNTYTGKGDGDWLDYGVELGGGAQATVSNSTISDCRGVASSDGSTSAGIMATTFFGAGTAGTITGNVLTANTMGIAVGYDSSDTSAVVAHDNSIYANTDYAICSTGPAVDASGNWYGTADPAGVAALVSDYADYTPWLADGTDTEPGTPGFQGDFSELWVDDDSPQTGTTGRIQEGIDLVSGSTVNVAAGTYAENVTINKSVDLRGPNYGISPNTGSRVAEAIVVPATSAISSGEILMVSASNVSIDGFTIDGDNTSLTSGYLGTNGADLDAAEAVTIYYDNVNNLTVSNNIVQNLSYFGVTLFGASYSAPATTGHLIHDNLVRDMGTYDTGSGVDKWGGGVLLYNNQYARVTDNVMENVRIGVQTGNFSRANPGSAQYQVIDGNTIEARRRGIFHNLHYGPTSPYTLSNNEIAAVADVNETVWDGILLASLSVASTTSANTIDGSAVSVPSEGYEVWNVKSTTPAVISAGSVSGVSIGVFVNNYEGYASDAGDGAHASISSLSISPNAGGIGIRVLDSASSTHANVQLTIGSGVSVSGGAHGLSVENANATLVSMGNIAFSGQTGNYIQLLSNAGNIDATSASFDGKTGAMATLAENFAIEDKVVHKVDDSSLGLVRVKAGELFVTPSSGLVQRGVDAATAGDIVNVAAGEYEEQVVVAKNLTLLGAGPTSIIKAPVSMPTCFTTSAANKPIVCIKDSATVDVDSFTIDGAGRGNTNNRFSGVAFRNAGGTVQNCVVKEIGDTPFSGAQHGVAIYAYNDDTTGRTINVWDNEIYGFQKNAMALNAGDTTPLVVDVQRNEITGAGTTTVTAQNGIQVWADLGSGTVAYNDITGIAYDGSGWVATSILNYYADLNINYNDIVGAHTAVYNIEGSGQINGNDLAIIKAGGYGWGIIASDPPGAVPSPFGGEEMAGAGGATTSGVRIAGTLNVDISDNTVTFSGTDNTGTYGIEGDAGYGPDDIAVTANGNTVTGFEVGIEIWQGSTYATVFTSVTANDNCLSANTYGMRSNADYLVVDGTSNWWGDASGPYHPTKNPGGTGDEVSDYIDFEPWIADGCGGTTTAGNWYNTTTLVYDDFQTSLDNALTGETIRAMGASPMGGGGIANVAGVTVDLNGRTAGPGSPFLTVYADDVTVKGPGKIDGGGGGGAGIVVQAGADNFILEGIQVTGWENGIQLAGSVNSFKIVSNWIHSNTGHGLLIDSGVTLGGVVTIEGNLFKVNGGNGIQHNGSGTLPAEYNSWGDIGGYSTGDGIGGSVDADPFTYVEYFFDVEPDTLALERLVGETTTFDVALKADAVNLYGLTFKFTYDTAKLTLNSTTFSAPWAGQCFALPGSPVGTVYYYCGLYNPSPEWTATAGTIATFNFTAFTGTPGDGPWEALFDLSHLETDTSAAAVGGVKVFVNNAGFNDPSTTDRDITDGNDGKITIERGANYTGYVDLQGNKIDSGAVIKIYNQAAKSGAILLAQGTTNAAGAYTTAWLSPWWLGVSYTYYMVVDAYLYLPTTATAVTDFAHSALLDVYPLTTLANLKLLGGDATNNDYVDILDLSCIGGRYGLAPATCGTDGWADVTGDGLVDILDLSLAAGNYEVGYSPWVP